MKKFFVVFAIMAIIFTWGVTFLDSRPSEEQCRQRCLQEDPNMDPETLSFCIGDCLAGIS